MTAKICVIVCTLSVVLASTASQCIGREIMCGGLPGPFPGSFDMPYGPALPPVGCGAGLGPNPSFTPAMGYGGGLAVTSSSPIAPTGLTITSENTIEGVVAVTGQLPFLGAVATDGLFPTVGAGDVRYGCGDGAVGIVAEAPITPAAVAPALGYGPSLSNGLPYNGFVGPVGYTGCGFGAIY